MHHEPNSIEVANFLNKGIFIDVQVVDSECAVHRLKHEELGEIRGKLSNNFSSGAIFSRNSLEHNSSKNTLVSLKNQGEASLLLI